MKEKLEWSMAEGRCAVYIVFDGHEWMGNADIDGFTVVSVREKATIDELRDAMRHELDSIFTDLSMMSGWYLPKEG